MPQLVPPVELDASQYSLILDGQELPGPVEMQYDALRHAFGFRLTRTDNSELLWRSLLGSPGGPYRTVTVALRLRTGCPAGCKNNPSTIVGSGGSDTFSLEVFNWPSFWVAVAVVILVLAVVVGTARGTTTLRDALLPQLPPNQQPYSLGRCQMAFWFVLIFASFIFLYILLWDFNTVSGQALALMGIASATALASVAVDVYKDSPADAANRSLLALGIKAPADLVRINNEIAIRTPGVQPAVARFEAAQAASKAAADASNRVQNDPNASPAQKVAADDAAKAAAQAADEAHKELRTLQGEIEDRRNILRTYDDTVAPFRTVNFFSDLTTDVNGPTVHRLQVVFWTLALGAVFLVGVYRDLAMPNFSSTLLALMGISGAGYVGFKYPERNN